MTAPAIHAEPAEYRLVRWNCERCGTANEGHFLSGQTAYLSLCTCGHRQWQRRELTEGSPARRAADAAILAEHRASEQRAILENRDTASSDIRNALGVIDMGRVEVSTGDVFSLTSKEIAGVRDRLAKALAKLERGEQPHLNPNTSFRDVVRGLREAMKCDRCGKSTRAFNTSIGRQRGYRPERITKETHCACPATNDQPAGPAFGL